MRPLAFINFEVLKLKTLSLNSLQNSRNYCFKTILKNSQQQSLKFLNFLGSPPPLFPLKIKHYIYFNVKNNNNKYI